MTDALARTPALPFLPMSTTVSDVATGVLMTASDGHVVLRVPGTNYLIRLACAADERDLAPHVGRRVRGVVHAKALKMNHAAGGGVFIEPVDGHPRIVQGRVIATDIQRNRVLADVVVPMWLEVAPGQAASDFATGQLLNFYVQSGATFTPVA